MNLNEFYDLANSGNEEKLRKLHVKPNEAKPGDVTICDMRYALVIDVKSYLPGDPIRNIINPPIREDYDAIAIFTTNGVRWHGVPI